MTPLIAYQKSAFLKRAELPVAFPPEESPSHPAHFTHHLLQENVVADAE